MIKIYLDMDGVLSNFEKEFRKYNPKMVWDRSLFFKAIDDEIFARLEPFESGALLIEEVVKLHQNVVAEHKKYTGIHDYITEEELAIEILTSTGTSDKIYAPKVQAQKKQWLEDHGIFFPVNFVSKKSEKANYATSFNMLIDDHPDCVLPFRKAGGWGIIHDHKDLDKTIKQLHTDYEYILSSWYA